MRVRDGLEAIFVAIEPLVTAALYPLYVLRRRWRGRRAVPILMYHQVGAPVPGVPATRECVSPERFAAQMATVAAAGYRVISLSDLAGRLGGRDGSEDCAVITFDDGLRDQARRALPVLARHGFRATFFIIAGHVGADAPFPHLGFDGAGATPPSGWLPLSWRDLEQLAESGMEIGSHTVSHQSLGALDPADVEREVRDSRRILERALDRTVAVFAYPFGSAAYGDVNTDSARALRACGYVAACTTVVGTNAAGCDALALRRIPVEERDGAFRLRCKLIGAYDWVGIVKARWQSAVSRDEATAVGPLVTRW